MTTREKVIIIVFLFIMGCAGFKFYRYKAGMEKQYTEAIAWANGKDETVKKYMDDNNDMHDKIQTMTVDRTAFINANKKFVDSIAKLNRVKPKNITSITTVSESTSDSFSAAIDTPEITIADPNISKPGKGDSIKVRTANFKDKSLVFKEYIGKDSIFGKYTYTDSLIYVGSQKRSGFLGMGKMKTFLDVSSNNPNTVITNAKSVQLVKVKDYKWTVGPYIGYGYDGLRWSPSVGISLQYSLFKF